MTMMTEQTHYEKIVLVVWFYVILSLIMITSLSSGVRYTQWHIIHIALLNLLLQFVVFEAGIANALGYFCAHTG